jgi:hypothetical protein
VARKYITSMLQNNVLRFVRFLLSHTVCNIMKPIFCPYFVLLVGLKDYFSYCYTTMMFFHCVEIRKKKTSLPGL